ncbi:MULTISPECIES: hypothetical protein [Helcococcus]|uniref:Phage tail protein n=1 Tax=Helcococcus bovis TaxID=3153252 RepID=A0ABW9F5T0_9FIRM
MKYEVKIGNTNLYKDFGLVPTSKPIINLASPKVSYIEVPGVQGQLEVDNGVEIIYSNREGSLEFLVSDLVKFETKYQEFLNSIHGVKNTISIDSKYFYYGRFIVEEIKTDKNYTYVEISYILEPFKYFKEDINSLGVKKIEKFSTDISTDNIKEIRIDEKSQMYIKPNFRVKSSSNLIVIFNNKEYKLYDGVNIVPQIKAKNSMLLKFKGRGTVEISYKRGDL